MMSEKNPSSFLTSILKVLPLVWSIHASMTLCSTQWVPAGQGPSSLVPISCIPVLLAINILNSTDLPSQRMPLRQRHYGDHALEMIRCTCAAAEWIGTMPAI